MHQLFVATADGKIEKRPDVEQISDLLTDHKAILWLDLTNPTEADLALLHDEFSFHPLSIEDVTTVHQRPKVDSYDSYYLIVFYTLGYKRDADARLDMIQVGLFIGTHYLVTVHAQPVVEIQETITRWQRNRDAIGDTVGAVVYALLDAIVDNYFPIIDQLAEQIEVLEERIFEKFNEEAINEVFSLKKDLLHLRRVVSPTRDVLNVLIRRDMPIFERETIVYMQDVYDHVVRVTDSIDTYRDLLSSALDGYLSMASNKLNQTMRVLTASSIVLMTMSLVAGTYGMNFKFMPELEWPLGYGFALLLMVSLGAGLVIAFRRRGWL